jgi:GT2 family glycosyltransferase
MTIAASVIVPTHNRPHLLMQSLRALIAQAPDTPPYEIIAVDDASTDDTWTQLTTLAQTCSFLRPVRHKANKGLSGSRNTGIRLAQGKIVVFLDDDIVVEPNYVAEHLRLHAAAGHRRIAVVGNLTLPDSTMVASNCARYVQSRYIGERAGREGSHQDPESLHPRFLGGGIHSVRKEDILAVGMFDESVRFYGYEDHIYADSLHRAGVGIVFAPQARAVHLDPVSVGWFRSKMLEAGRSGLPLLREKCPAFVSQTALALLLPIDRSQDRGRKLFRKLALRWALNPLTVWMLERWALATDHLPQLYSGTLYRALNAGWLLQGQRLRPGHQPLVRYGS